jgi:hypothetical protein
MWAEILSPSSPRARQIKWAYFRPTSGFASYQVYLKTKQGPGSGSEIFQPYFAWQAFQRPEVIRQPIQCRSFTEHAPRPEFSASAIGLAPVPCVRYNPRVRDIYMKRKKNYGGKAAYGC